MSIVKIFNGLNGSVVTRKAIDKMIAHAVSEEQPEVASRLRAVIDGAKPKEKKFTFAITSPAIETIPAGLMACFQPDDLNEESGLGKVSQQDIYDQVTEMMLNTIQKVGHLPWQKEWTGSGGDAAKNYVTKKTYTGINFIMLNFEQKKDADGKPYLTPINFTQPYYLTFNQIEAAGAKLKKGSRASQVFYYTPLYTFRKGELSISTSDTAKFKEFLKQNKISAAEKSEFSRKINVIKYYNVFRADDCTGLTFPERAARKIVEPIEVAQAMIDSYPNPPQYTFGGDGAFYMPKADVLNMPVLEDFSSPAFYYSTYFHEMVHSTGHSKRLDRGNDTRKRDGSADDKKAYAFEELVAELGAVYLCSEAGILFHTKENNAKYLAHWNKQLVALLQEDNRLFFRAAAAAQKGTNHILDFDTDQVAAYLRNHTEKKPKQSKEPVKPPAKKPVKAAKKSETEIVGYALVDNISGEVMASKKTLEELKLAYESIEIKVGDMPVLVYQVTNVRGKNKLGKPVVVDWQHPSQKKNKPAPAKQLNLFEGLTGAKKKAKSLQASKSISETQSNEKGLTGTMEPVAEVVAVPVSQPRPIAEPLTVAAPQTTQPEHQQPGEVPKNSKIQKIGGSGEPSEWISMDGEISKFLQRVERKPVHSVVITMDGEKGAGKTTTLYKMIDAFYRAGNRSVFMSFEEHTASALAKEKAEKFLDPDTAANLDTVCEVDTAQELYDIISDYDIIFIDSWQKLVRMVGNIHLDEDLRKRFHGKVFVIIFQQTTTGRTKGGAEIGFDGDIIIKMVKGRRFEENYAYFDKHRYTKVPIETIHYNIASGTIYNPEESAETEPVTTEQLPPVPVSPLQFTIN